jgi:hypothetical protein
VVPIARSDKSDPETESRSLAAALYGDGGEHVPGA